eukprot:365811-Chlamydomonas_euryale.AAC.29
MCCDNCALEDGLHACSTLGGAACMYLPAISTVYFTRFWLGATALAQPFPWAWSRSCCPNAALPRLVRSREDGKGSWGCLNNSTPACPHPSSCHALLQAMTDEIDYTLPCAKDKQRSKMELKTALKAKMKNMKTGRGKNTKLPSGTSKKVGQLLQEQMEA